jgi:sugar phosphate isomerase/epimerase
MVAVSTVAFDGLGLARAAEILSELGIAEVEVAYIDGYMAFDEGSFTARAGREVASLFAGHGVAMRAVSAHTDLGRADSIDRLLRRLDFAVGAGLDTLISNATATAARAAFMRTVEAVLPRLSDAGVVLALENPGHGRDVLLPDGRTGAAIVATWDSPWLRLNYDIGNAWTYAGGRIDLAADLDAALPVVRRVHLKDVAERGPDWHFCPFGAGAVGYGGRLPVAPLHGLDATLEHPLRLWRPGRADPARRSAVPTEAEMRSSIAASVASLRDLGFR